MKCKLDYPEIISSDAFANCKLNRQIYGEVLEKAVELYKGGCVLAINGEWGTGKTTFVKMWKQYHENKEFKTLYFNVWENDFMTDPIVGLVGELKKIDGNNKKATEKIVAAAGKILCGVIPSVAKEIFRFRFGNRFIEIFESGAKAASDLCKKEIDDYEKQSASIDDFKKSVEDYVLPCSKDKPLVFIVDELDRCNPTYAVKLLERIKHLFSIKNIVFVLSIDKQQLCNSIRGYYGSDLINAEEYLKRFIDIEYNMPKPDAKVFCDYLYKEFSFEKYVAKQEDETISSFDINLLPAMLLENNNLTLRGIEKLYSQTSLVLYFMAAKSKVNFGMAFLLIFIRTYNDELYEKIRKKSISARLLRTELENYLPTVCKNLDYKYDETPLTDVIIRLIACYTYDPLYSNLLKELFVSYDGDLISLDKFNGDYKRFTSNKKLYGIINIDDVIEQIELAGDFEI